MIIDNTFMATNSGSINKAITVNLGMSKISPSAPVLSRKNAHNSQARILIGILFFTPCYNKKRHYKQYHQTWPSDAKILFYQNYVM
jgi:hypothetical protein